MRMFFRIQFTAIFRVSLVTIGVGAIISMILLKARGTINAVSFTIIKILFSDYNRKVKKRLLR